MKIDHKHNFNFFFYFCEQNQEVILFLTTLHKLPRCEWRLIRWSWKKSWNEDPVSYFEESVWRYWL